MNYEMHRDYDVRESYSRHDAYDIRGVPLPYDRDRVYERYDMKRDRPAPYDRGRITGYQRDGNEDYPRYRENTPGYRYVTPRYRTSERRYRGDLPRYRDENPRYRDDVRRYRDEPTHYRDDHHRYRDDHSRNRDYLRHRVDGYDGRDVHGRHYDSRYAHAEPPKSKIFVGSLEGRVTEEELAAAFSKFGPINKLDFRRSFAFVDYVKARDAETAMREMHGKTLSGSILRVLPHTERSKRLETGRQPDFSSQVTILNLDENASWQDLKDFGRQGGEVIYASVIIRDGKRYGLIEFANPQAMKDAAAILNGKSIAQNVLEVIPMAVNDYVKSKSIEQSGDEGAFQDVEVPQDVDVSVETGEEENGELIYPDDQVDTVEYD